MFHQQFFQSNVASCRLAKIALLVAEAAIVTVSVTVFATPEKAYASDDSVRFTPIPSLQEMSPVRKPLGSAKDLGIVKLDLSTPFRPCYVGSVIGCVIGEIFISPEQLLEISEGINSTRMRPFKSEPSSAQARLIEFSF